MTQEEKQLLLKDLCARLPYEVKCKVNYIINNETTYGEDVESECIDIIKRISFDSYSVYTEWLGYESNIEDIKPYLRSMSSMTEEEEDKYRAINCYEGLFPCNEDALDYALSHHLDFRGLIPMGIAMEAPEGMYN